MPKKQWSPEEKEAFAKKMAAARQSKAQEAPEAPDFKEDIQGDPDIDVLKKQMQEVMETNALLKAALLNQTPGAESAQRKVDISKTGTLLGEVDKYLVDPDNYPESTPRLKTEQRLQPLAFNYNYELEYSVSVSSYETKSGINMREPKFHVNLNRIVLDSQGEQTPKRYIARRMVFHEDPQAALVIARDNNIELDRSDERVFLNEMRYLRVRDWLYDIFWPKPDVQKEGIHEEVIGGTVVQVFTKSSEDPGEIDFNQIKTKMV